MTTPEYEETQTMKSVDDEVGDIINKKEGKKKKKKDRSAAAKKAWITRKEKYGDNGISDEGLEIIRAIHGKSKMEEIE